jgi:carboxypeptidase T
MNSGKKYRVFQGFLLGIAYCAVSNFSGMAFAAQQEDTMRFLQIEASNKEQRSQIANMGISIEAVRSDSVWAFADSKGINKLNQAGFDIWGNFDLQTARGGHEDLFGFPTDDERFHTYDELIAELQTLHKQNSDITAMQSIGKTIEGRDIWAFHINTAEAALKSGTSSKPGAIFMGNHHAREHVSAEIPLMLIQYLLKNRDEAKVKAILDTRDIWIVPMVNPDGAEFDISTGRYKWWRKNRRDNKNGTFGVDLNRNYAYKWGTGGSDKEPSSEVYMGTEPFSEPETQAIRDFVKAHINTKILLSFHTFSELVLYPWGYTYDGVTKTKDAEVFKKMAKTMAAWNHYTPQQSSELYIASGDTTDWAYGELGIFAFTFELSPSSMWQGGFYPGAKILDKVFQDNLQPCMYLLDVAGDPYQVLDNQPTGMLKNYVEPRDSFSEIVVH